MRLVVAFVVAAVTFTCLDLIFLGVLMADFYDGQLGVLKAKPVVLEAAVLFYLFYLSFIIGFAVRGASSARDSFQRGAGMGLFAYGTFELTSWAVIQNWPAGIIIVDMIWGTFLTGSIALISRFAYERLTPQVDITSH